MVGLGVDQHARRQIHAVMRFEDLTQNNANPPQWIKDMDAVHWNRDCLDIRKSTLDG